MRDLMTVKKIVIFTLGWMTIIASLVWVESKINYPALFSEVVNDGQQEVKAN